MIDNFSLAVSHGLMLIAAWRLIFRRDLDAETPPKPDPEAQGFRKGRPRNA
jgi:hypothetical protein